MGGDDEGARTFSRLKLLKMSCSFVAVNKTFSLRIKSPSRNNEYIILNTSDTDTCYCLQRAKLFPDF